MIKIRLVISSLYYLISYIKSFKKGTLLNYYEKKTFNSPYLNNNILLRRRS